METQLPDRQLDLLALCETVKANAEEIVEFILGRWREIGSSEPWLALPDDLSFDHLPELVRKLAAASLGTDFDRDLCRETVEIAAEHGAFRGREGFGDSLIYREYHLLRRTLWERMRDSHGDTATVYYATMRIDTLVSVAGAAGLLGMNRTDLAPDERRAALDRLLDEWPLPTS